jgi:flagellar hook assembly protein FlgD
VPRPGHVRLSIYDVAGRLVRTLVNEPRPEGLHSVSWEGRDESGRSVASGVYLSRMEAGDFVATQRMVRSR